MNALASLVLLIPLLAAPSSGGSLLASSVSADATWVVYADYEQLGRTQFGPLLRQELTSLGIDRKLQEFAKIFGFHPLDDVREVLLYGVGYDREKGVVLLRGSFDADKLLAPIRTNTQYQEIPYREGKLYRWAYDEPKAGGVESRVMYGSILKGDLVVISAGLDMLKRAIDVLEGVLPRAGLDRFELPASSSSPSFLLVAANGVSQAASPYGRSAVFRQTERLGFAVGETGGQLRADLSLVASSGETASAISQMAQGMVAYLTLAGADEPWLAAVAKKARISCGQSVVRISVECSPKEVAQFLAEKRLSAQTRPAIP